MANRVKLAIGFTVVFCFALVGVGMGAIYRLDAIAQREKGKELEAKLAKTQEELETSYKDYKDLVKRMEKLQEQLKNALTDLEGKDAEMRAQRDRIGSDMREQLDKERRKNRELLTMNSQQENQRGRGRRGFMDMEKLKTEDPERYQQIMNRRQEMQQRMQERHNKQQQLVQKLDTSKMSPERRQQVERYKELTAQFEKARQNMENLTPEERREQMMANRDSFHEMMGLQNVIRDEAINQAVQSGDTEAAKEAMELFGGPGGGRRGGFGGPGGRGGFGGPPRGGF